ncbi:MAG: TIGR03663 family protein [Verrucomicrobiota bacterium]
MTRGLLPGILLAALIALLLRWPGLEQRPFHNDEAVNAVKFGQLWNGDGYRYDPNEHHGPVLAYATCAWAGATGGGPLSGFTEARFRQLTALFGVALILLLPLLADGLGAAAAFWSACLLAVSPAMVFYSRDYIHEMLLAFFTFLALAAAWRYSCTRGIGWAILAGAAAGLAQATKETFVLAGIAAAVAWLLNRFCESRIYPAQAAGRRRLNRRHLAAGLVSGLVAAGVLYSSFFQHRAGIIDAFRAFDPWIHRAEGASPHVHPVGFYFSRLASGEGLVLLLGAAGGWFCLAGRRPRCSHAGFLRFLAFYTAILTLIYCAIPYKTPWCLVQFYLGWVLLAGIGATALLERIPGRALKILATVALGAGVLQLAARSRRAALSEDLRRNPYAYAETSPDVRELVAAVERVAAAAPQPAEVRINVVAPADDYWPLPWYLGSFHEIGWWHDLPADAPAPIQILSLRLQNRPGDSASNIIAGTFELRPGNFFELQVETNLWQSHLAR